MKLSPVYLQQHLGQMFRRHWKLQGKRIALDNGSLKSLNKMGIEYEDAVDVISEKPKERKLWPIRGVFDKKPELNETHPDFHEDKCLTYGDHNVLLAGIDQAKVLTNTVQLDAGHLVSATDKMTDDELQFQDKLVRRCLRSSLMFDATQEKLPKRHDPEREAWNFPRDYGITDKRRNYLLVNRLIQLCASFNPQLLGERAVYNYAKFTLPVILPTNKKALFSVRGDAVVFSSQGPSVPIQPSDKELSDLTVPDLSPLSPSISLESTSFCKFEPSFPLNPGSRLNKVHTVMLHFNETEVYNITETPVTTDQILGRSMLQSWIYAMSQANQNRQDMAEPVTVQTVQTNGQFFHFSAFQLRSTSTDQSGLKNLYWSLPIMNIYDTCSYVKGKPTLEGYNPEVFKTLLAFYNS